MAAHCRGKQMLRKSLDDESKRKLKKRKSTKELAKWWISVGLDPDGFKLIYISDYIGYGVFTTKEFSKSDFLLQYKGIRITNEEAKEAEKKHSKYNMGCFMFYFTFHDKKYCIDATESHGFLGHMVNDGRGMLQNCHMQLVVVNSVPYLCLFALRDIKNGEQLLYDYGDNTVHWLTKKYKVNEDVISCSDVTSDLFEPSAESESESLSSELSFIPAPRKRKYTADVGFGNRKLEYIKKTKKTVDLNDLTFTGLLKKKTKDHENDIVPDSCPSSECAPSHHVIEIGVPPVEGNDGASTEDNTEEVADELNHDTLHELRGEAEDAACINDKTEQAVNELNLDPLHELRERTEDAVCINDKTEEAANELNLDPLHESFEDKLNETYVKEKKTETDVEDELKLASDSVQINIEENDACSTQVEEKNSKTTVDISTNKMSLKRPCSYCMKMFCGRKLKRHIFRKHKDNPEVKFIMKKSKAEQLRFFSEKRSDAIYKHNIKIMHETAGNQDSRNLLRERRPKYLDMLRMCAGCNKFISNKCFYKHKITCSSNTPDAINTYTLGKKNIHQDKEFEDILSRFTENEAGILCKENSVIQQVGYRHFCLRRAEVSKTDEIRKSVMSEMRELARLFIKFKELSDTSVTVEDMFTRAHLKTLREAIDNLASREDGSGKEKYGLKLNINSIIKRSIKSLKGFYSEKLDDDKKKELMHFKDAYDFRAPEIFSNARYQCISNSMNKARRPAELPVESEVQKLGQFINEQIPIAQRNKNYRWLRSLLVSKLTLYNARRGDEPSRMLVQEFEDALNGTWLPDFAMQEVKDEGEKYLVNQFHLAYILGKGKKSYVPILIPKDIIQAISFLKDNRHLYDIPDENPFIFATKSKMSHCSGWHAVKGVCRQASVNVNATENRHRISTFFSGLHMSDKDKEVFYEHMGHAEAINKDNYQCPLGIKEVTVMGKFLNGLENGEINGIHHVTDFSTEETQSASGENQREKGTTSQTTSRMQLEASVSNGIPMKKPSNAVPTDKPIQANVSSVPIIEPDKEVPADKPIQVSWTSADNILLRKYFSDFFAENATSHNNKGCLPNITPEIQKLGKPDCVSLLKQVACQECSPYAAHVYETEGGGPKKVLPGLCNKYCSELYSKCEKVIPLLTQNQDVLDSLLSSKSDFCKLAELNDDIYCYPELLTNPVLTLELKRTTDSKDGCICLQEFASGIGNPLLLMSSDDLDHSNLVYVGVQAGIIYMYEDGKRLNDVFLDITDKVLTSSGRGDERGLFGLAFHTDFKKTQKFYVHYTHIENFQEFGIVSEFKTMKANLKKADKESEKVILKIRQPWSNHNGGSIIYSHDGFLYVFLGDGGSGWDPQNNGQNIKTLLGSVLRINVDTEDPPLKYSIPKDNPFVGKAGRDEIWAYGVRNPFRATEDRGDPKTGEGKGRIFMADVGQNMWEEVDILEKGGNYGWKIKEGPRCLGSSCKGFVEPIAAYNHFVGRSIIGGYVYRGCESPNFNGLYIYGDYTAGDLFRLKQVKANEWQNKNIDICKSDLCFNGLTNQYQKLVLSFGEDYDGELYVLTSDTAGPLDKEGKIYKLVDPRRRGPPSSCRSYREPVTTKPVLQEPTKKPTTKKPTTKKPTTKKPTTKKPRKPTSYSPTFAPTTPAPITYAPTTSAPTLSTPTKPAQIVVTPTTHAPTSPAPSKHASTAPTPAPTIVTPSAHTPTAHITTAPTTPGPSTLGPITTAPTHTPVPTSSAPTNLTLTHTAPTDTLVPTSSAPTNLTLTHTAPTDTLVPTSSAPTNLTHTTDTLVPTTSAPTNLTHTTHTLVPTTSAPTNLTHTPTAPTHTLVPTISAPTNSTPSRPATYITEQSTPVLNTSASTTPVLPIPAPTTPVPAALPSTNITAPATPTLSPVTSVPTVAPTLETPTMTPASSILTVTQKTSLAPALGNFTDVAVSGNLTTKLITKKPRKRTRKPKATKYQECKPTFKSFNTEIKKQ